MEKRRKQELLETAYEKGRQYEARATDCCQSTVAAIQETIGCRNDDILKSGSAFAGGVGFTGLGSCGALTGAVMVLGQLCGRTREEFDNDAKREINDPSFDDVGATKGWNHAYEMVERFMIEYGSPLCREIRSKLGRRIQGDEYVRPDSPAQSLLSKKRQEKNITSAHEMEGCPTVVGNAAKWATEIILREHLDESCRKRSSIPK